MKTIIFYFLLILMGHLLFVSCEVESGVKADSLTDSGKNVFNYIESDFGNILELFENSLRLNKEMQKGNTGDYSVYFEGETIFQDLDGWWGVTNWDGCRFKVYSLDDKSFWEEGAMWIAQSKYYYNDSIGVECLGANHWSLKGYIHSVGTLKTEVQMEISTVEMNPSSNLDSVAYYVNMKGISHYTQYYPSTLVEINFSVVQPFMRPKKAANVYYPFMDGLMDIEVTETRNGQKQQFLIQIESLPLNQRMIRITSKGVSETY